MKTPYVLSILVGLAIILAGCNSGPSQTFTVSGELLAIAEAERHEVLQSMIDDGAKELIDLTNATISVAVKSTDEHGEQFFEELGSKSFAEGQASLKLAIDQPREVRITVNAESDKKYELLTEAEPGAELSVVLLELQPFATYFLLQLGQAPKFVNADSKFVISGDLSSIDSGFSNGAVRVRGRYFDEDQGKFTSKRFGRVLAVEGKFRVEGVVDKPMVVRVEAEERMEFQATTEVIVEPDSKIEISFRSGELLGVSGEGKHAEIIESWQLSEEYVAKLDAAAIAKAEHHEKVEPQVTAGDSHEATTVDADSDMQTDQLISHAIDQVDPADGCEHVDASGLIPSALHPTDENTPEHVKLSNEVVAIRHSALLKFVEDVSNPEDAFLAMMLDGPDLFSDASLPSLDNLISHVEEGQLRRAMTVLGDSIRAIVESRENDERLVPGQLAPPFTLANIDGEETALYDVLNESEVVLVDFWASWCMQCLLSFRDLTELYTSYNDDGFEIVTVSIYRYEGSLSAEKQAVLKPELPWIDVGDPNRFKGATPISYGVHRFPKNYLVDSKGCILEKDVHVDQLQALLDERFPGGG